MLFGEFLFLKCVVDEVLLLSVLGEQARSRPWLGELAVREGFMTAWDVYRVMNEQTLRHRPFGEVAIGLGLLDEEELRGLLDLQDRECPMMGEILVRRGALTQQQLDELLVEFEELRSRERRRRSA